MKFGCWSCCAVRVEIHSVWKKKKKKKQRKKNLRLFHIIHEYYQEFSEMITKSHRSADTEKNPQSDLKQRWNLNTTCMPVGNIKHTAIREAQFENDIDACRQHKTYGYQSGAICKRHRCRRQHKTQQFSPTAQFANVVDAGQRFQTYGELWNSGSVSRHSQ